MFGFFTIAVTKPTSSILPLIPAVAIFLALFWGMVLNKHVSPRISLQITAWVNLLFVTIIAITSFYTTKIMDSDPAAPEFCIT